MARFPSPPVLVHHPLHRGLLRRQYVGRSVVVRSVGCYLLPTPPPPTDAAKGRTPRRFPRHARYSSRTTRREATERTRLARSLALGSRQQPTTESVGRRPSIHPSRHPRSVAVCQCQRRPLSRRFQTCQTIIRHRTHALPLRRTKTGSEQLERGGRFNLERGGRYNMPHNTQDDRTPRKEGG